MKQQTIIPKKTARRVQSVRLLDFHICDEKRSSDDSSSQDSSGSDKTSKFTIQMFGINEKGQTFSIQVNDFNPFFFVKVGDNWEERDVALFMQDLKTKIGPFYAKSIVDCKLVDKYKLYGFSGGKKSKFIQLSFDNQAALNKVKNCWFYYTNDTHEKKMKTYIFPPKNGIPLELYESNIPPVLRYFHIHNISPSGWVYVPAPLEEEDIQVSVKTTTCHYEIQCLAAQIRPIQDKETRVPYKICSFDIEASSSHGDFPIPKKTYKRLATNLVDCFIKQAITDKERGAILVKKVIMTAFQYDHFDDVDLVYPKETPTKESVGTLVQRLLKTPMEIIQKGASEKSKELIQIDSLFQQMNQQALEQGGEGDGEEGGEEGEGEEEWKKVPKKSAKGAKRGGNEETNTLLDVLIHITSTRDEKINKLSEVLTCVGFPELEGDKTTFIGSTFMRYGEKEPYLNHCIVLNSCDPVDGAVIETVETERDLLLQWTELIQKENPDIIIGYNIFGFDYEFMFRRAQENSCHYDFLKLSRKIGEICVNTNKNPRDKDSEQLSLENTKIQIASGEYDLRYPRIAGRLQIDMYAYLRRDFNLSSYKLDDVAGQFICDDVKKMECIDHQVYGQVTELYSQNLTGLHKGDYIHIELSSFTSDYYKDGQKFMILDIEKDRDFGGKKYNVILIQGHETVDSKQTIKWCMAKDDVTPQDIFRLSNGSSADRARVAKYCIQDCNLVHHLLNKIDVITGYVEMSRICSIPISFLVFRGQGIKLTSYVAKKCRDKNTLMPDLEKSNANDGYEGAIVLPPKCSMYMDNPVACVDYSSLYPSSMISQNYSPDSKVWTKEFDLDGNLQRQTGQTDGKGTGTYIYDNLPGYEYIDLEFDLFEYRRDPSKPSAKAVKTKVGTKICRWAQFPDGKKGIMPSILEELLKARSETRKKIKTEKDPFMQNILDKRQLGYKVTANSLYGQCGSKTSTFFEKDVAASTTATGRTMIIYAKTMIEQIYGDRIYTLKSGESIQTRAEYIYGDSVASYTPVLVKANGSLVLLSIVDLAHLYGFDRWVRCIEQGKQEKEFCELEGVESWTETGWTPLKRVIRHMLAPHKKMIRILTRSGLVDVTDDHSLLTPEGQEISPTQTGIGTPLLHQNFPPSIVNMPIDLDESRLLGFFFGCGHCDEKGVNWLLKTTCPDMAKKYVEIHQILYPKMEWAVLDKDKDAWYEIVCFSTKYADYHKTKNFKQKYRALFYDREGAKQIPAFMFNMNPEGVRCFWEGFRDSLLAHQGDRFVYETKDHLTASHVVWLAESRGWDFKLDTIDTQCPFFESFYRKVKWYLPIDGIRIKLTKQSKPPLSHRNYIRKMGQIPYTGFVYDLTTENHHFAAGVGHLIVHNTDSVFFTFNLEHPETKEKIRGKEALEMTIEIAQDAAHLCSQWLKPPMELSYEKTLVPFILLSKKRYVGKLYEEDPNKGKMKIMGLSLKRRDSCDYLKDTYGEILNILMEEQNITKAVAYLKQSLTQLIQGKVHMDKLKITKALRGYYKNPKQIAHAVLAERIGQRDPGNKPKPGDRLCFVHIVNHNKNALQGEKIETPEFILSQRLKIDYAFYITNQLLKPLSQLFGLAIEEIKKEKDGPLRKYKKDVEQLKKENPDFETFMKKKEKYCSSLIKKEIFDDYLTKIENVRNGNQEIRFS